MSKAKARVAVIVPVVVLVAAVAAAVAIWGYYRERDGQEADLIRVSGNIEVTNAEVSFKIAGRVESRPVDEGESIRAGQLVARLESADLAQELALRQAELDAARSKLAELEAGSRPQEIAQADAAVAAAQAQLDELVAGSRPQEIAAAEAEVQSAQADSQRAKVEYDRLEKLRQEKFSAAMEYEVARAAYEAAKARVQAVQAKARLVKEGPRVEEIERARAALVEAQQRASLVKAGPRAEEIARARAQVGQADATLGLARTRLGYAELTSPLDGVVLSKNIEPGEYVAPGTPVVTVARLDSVWLRAYVNEADLGRVKLGQPVRVTTDTYPDKVYDGRVSFIASQAEFTPKNVQTRQERVKLVYRVKINIANPRLELKPGMPADAEILVDQPARPELSDHPQPTSGTAPADPER